VEVLDDVVDDEHSLVGGAYDVVEHCGFSFHLVALHHHHHYHLDHHRDHGWELFLHCDCGDCGAYCHWDDAHDDCCCWVEEEPEQFGDCLGVLPLHGVVGEVALGVEVDLEDEVHSVAVSLDDALVVEEAYVDEDHCSHGEVVLVLACDPHAYHDDDGVLEASHEGGDSLEDRDVDHGDDDLGDAHYGWWALHRWM